MSNKIILAASVMTALLLGFYGASGVAFAQYMGSQGETGPNTLEENLKLAEAKLAAIEECPRCGSGHLYPYPEDTVGASIIIGAVFGGVAVALFLRSRSGKYAAMGRG